MKLDAALMSYGLKSRSTEFRPILFHGGVGKEMPAGSCPLTKLVMRNAHVQGLLEDVLPGASEFNGLYALLEYHGVPSRRLVPSQEFVTSIGGVRIPDLWLEVNDLRHLPADVRIPTMSQGSVDRLLLCGTNEQIWLRLRFDLPDVYHELGDGQQHWFPGPIHQLTNTVRIILGNSP